MKIWVDDRLGRVKKLTPDIYGPIIEEAHKHGMLALAHVYYLKDAHGLVDAGIDGLMHLVRDEVMDDALIATMKERNVFGAANIGGTRRAGLPEAAADLLALLGESIPVSLVEEYRAGYAARDPKNVAFMKSRSRRKVKASASSTRQALPSRSAATQASPARGPAGPSTTSWRRWWTWG